MTDKTQILNKFDNKIWFFIPDSFDKFFETGKFEGKTNSVQSALLTIGQYCWSLIYVAQDCSALLSVEKWQYKLGLNALFFSLQIFWILGCLAKWKKSV